VPLVHPPGHAQADFGEAIGMIGGVERKIHFFVLTCRTRTAASRLAYPAETTEAFCDGHVRGVHILRRGSHSRSCTTTPGSRWPAFWVTASGNGRGCLAELQSHYLFEDRFGRPGKGNDKGKVEGLVGWIRRNFLVPIPVFESFEALNAYLLECCRRRMADRLRGHDGTIAERLERDLAAFQRPLPPAYDACEKVATRVSSLSLVRYRLKRLLGADDLWSPRGAVCVGYIHEVVISCGADIIARHARSYEREDFVFRSAALLGAARAEIGASTSGAASRLGSARRVRLAPSAPGSAHGQARQTGVRPGPAITGDLPPRRTLWSGSRRRWPGRDRLRCVKHLVLCRIERRPPRLDLTVYPYLPRAVVATTSGQELHGPAHWGCVMSDTPRFCSPITLKALKLPTFLREYDKLARQCAAEGVDHTRYLLRLAELELIDRERRTVEAADQGSKFRRSKKPRQLRLPGPAITEQRP